MFEVNGIAYASEKSNKISITDAKSYRSFNDDCDIFRR